jgi:hypothetical protein
MQDFIFCAGQWLGEGKISFTASPEFLKFFTKWQISEKESGVIQAIQTVEIIGMSESVINTFKVYEITSTTFSISLENPTTGLLKGRGLVDDEVIAWEFKNGDIAQGFEVYEKQKNGDYFLHAEYGGNDGYRTIVEGLVWKKNE